MITYSLANNFENLNRDGSQKVVPKLYIIKHPLFKISLFNLASLGQYHETLTVLIGTKNSRKPMTESKMAVVMQQMDTET